MGSQPRAIGLQSSHRHQQPLLQMLDLWIHQQYRQPLGWLMAEKHYAALEAVLLPQRAIFHRKPHLADGDHHHACVHNLRPNRPA